MRVFVTGASGFVGSVVSKELLSAGHQVIGLARSDESASVLTAAGIEVHRGSLDDVEGLKAAAAQADGVIHTAFIHDFTDFPKSCEIDKLAIEAMGEALVGTGKPFVVSSGTMFLKQGVLAVEGDAADLDNPMIALRAPSDNAALSFASRGVRVSIIRLPPTVHGEGDNHGFTRQLANIAREKGVSAYLGDGRSQWCATHRLDAAHLFCLALENKTELSVLHAAAEEGVPTRDIAGAIGKYLGVSTSGISMEEAQAHFGFLSFPLARDNYVSSKKTQELLGWKLTQPTLIADIEAGHYFKP